MNEWMHIWSSNICWLLGAINGPQTLGRPTSFLAKWKKPTWYSTGHPAWACWASLQSDPQFTVLTTTHYRISGSAPTFLNIRESQPTENHPFGAESQLSIPNNAGLSYCKKTKTVNEALTFAAVKQEIKLVLYRKLEELANIICFLFTHYSFISYSEYSADQT